MSSSWKLGLGFSLLTAVLWGGLPISLKFVLGEMDGITITWYRFSLSAVIALFWYGRRSIPAARRLLGRPLWPFTLLAVSGLLANYIFYLIGLDHTTAEAAQILIQLAPLMLLVGSVWLFKEPFSGLQWLGVVAFSVGLLLFFHHRLLALANVADSYLFGLLMLLLASVTWVVYGLAQKRLLRDVAANDLLLLIYIAGAICFLPAASPGQVMQLETPGLVMLAFASLNTIVAYSSFGIAMTHWEASRVSAVITIGPLLTLLFVFLSNLIYPGFIQTEPLDWMNWIGAVLVVGGSTVAAVGKRL
ncbi:MAG: DMT family transporter [Pseudomonadales bacterium]|nr:DMT family transporter [Halioglobus sp.]MCP5128738.1 DMT family transporter [Pseudomonadales bacterium]